MTRTIIYDLLIFLLVITLITFLKIPYLNIILAFILVLIYSYKRKGIKVELGFTKPKSLVKTICASIGLATCIVLISYFVLLPQIERITGHPLDLGIFKQLKSNTNLFIISLILGWVIGGFIEETIFRGFIISKFIIHLPHQAGAIIGIIVSSIIFGYLHTYQGPSGQILTGLVGLMLAIIFVISKRNLWLNIFTHGFVNTISMILLYFDIISAN